MTSEAFAGGVKCVVTNPNDNTTINMLMDWEQNGTTLEFDKPVAWAKDLLKFNVVYSNNIGNTHLIAATGVSTTGVYRQTQLVEIYFDNSKGEFKTGTLIAGDREDNLGRMAKFQEYTILCN